MELGQSLPLRQKLRYFRYLIISRPILALPNQCPQRPPAPFCTYRAKLCKGGSSTRGRVGSSPSMTSLLHRQRLHDQNTVTPHVTNIPHQGRQQQDDHHVFPNDLQTFINKMHFVRMHVAKREGLDGMRPSKGLRTTRTSRCDARIFIYQYIRRFNFLRASRLTIFISRS